MEQYLGMTYISIISHNTHTHNARRVRAPVASVPRLYPLYRELVGGSLSFRLSSLESSMSSLMVDVIRTRSYTGSDGPLRPFGKYVDGGAEIATRGDDADPSLMHMCITTLLAGLCACLTCSTIRLILLFAAYKDVASGRALERRE